jgi:peptidoglycan/LPS O-acetylase OafA/YrhL
LAKATATTSSVEATDGLASHRPSRRGFYRPELDALRFFAFFCIFCHHSFSRPNAGTDLRDTLSISLKFAVSLFFLLSGYLITTLLSMEKELTGRVHLGSFYRRRIARIWPLYYWFLVVVLLLGIGVPRLLPSGQALAVFFFFSGNWFLACGTAKALGAIGILWSVNVEEQFYLVWPVITRFCGWRNLFAVSTAILAVSYAVLVWLGVRGGFSDASLRFNSLVEMQFFAAGALLAAWLPRQGIRMPGAARLLLGAVGLSCWVAGTHLFGDTAAGALAIWWTPTALYGCVLIGCVALFLSFFGMPEAWIPQPILWLGKISYGLYVYHILVLTLMPRWPAGWRHWAGISAARLCLELLLAILLAGLSYRWIEQPFLRWKESFTFVPNRPA